MKKALFLFIFFGFPVFSIAQVRQNNYQFVENKTQWRADIRFKAAIPNGFLFVQDGGFTYVFHESVGHGHGHGHEGCGTESHGHDHAHAHERIAHALPDSGALQLAQNGAKPLKAHGLEVRFLGANEQARVEAQQKQGHPRHYFLGNNPEKWSKNVSVFGQVSYNNIYEDIDFHFLENDKGNLKYELLVRKGGNPEKIRLRYEGAEALYLENGKLYARTTLNTLIEEKPFSYQIIEGDTVKVPSNFKLEGQVLSFEFPQGYDANYDLVIDPVLVFAVYSNTQEDNWGNSATYDSLGNGYVAGTAFGSNFPVTSGAYQTSFSGQQDVIIMKYDPSGKNVLYATYLGGSESDIPTSILVNSKDELVIMGITGSGDFPVRRNAFSRVFGGGTRMLPFPRVDNNGRIPISEPYFAVGTDLFISILSKDGSNLVGSTYLGGSQNDGVTGGKIFFNGTYETSPLMRNYGDAFRGEVALDEDDNIYIASSTESSDFPITGSAYDRDLGGLRDAFVAKLSPTANRLYWATYLGGSQTDGAFGLRVNSKKQVIVVGGTASADFPTSSQALKPNYGGNTDGYVSMLSADGSRLLASSYLGTSRYDQAYLVSLDQAENVLVFGQTLGNYPRTAGSYGTQNASQFIHKLSPDLRRTLKATTIGTNNANTANFVPTAFTTTNCDQIYIAGWGGGTPAQGFNTIRSTTVGLETTANAFQKTTDGADFYLAVLSADFSKLEYATFLGANNRRGDHVDGGTSHFDPKGVVYQAVCSCAPDMFPEAKLDVQRDNCNMLLFKMDLSTLSARFEPSVKSGCPPLEVFFTNQSSGGKTFRWEMGDGTVFGGNSNKLHTFSKPGDYLVRLAVSDPTSCKKTDYHYDTIRVHPNTFAISADTTLCDTNASFRLNASGAETYQWIRGDVSNPNIANPVISPQKTTTYAVALENKFGCKDTLQTTVTIKKEIDLDFDFAFVNQCKQPGLVTFNSQNTESDSLVWQIGTLTEVRQKKSFSYNFEADGDYIVTLKTSKKDLSCAKKILTRDTVRIRRPRFSIVNDTTLCLGETLQLRASGATKYRWLSDEITDKQIPNPVVKPAQNTTYRLAVENEFGCKDTLQTTVKVTPVLDPKFSYTFPDRCKKPGEVHFFNQSDGVKHFVWRIGDLANVQNKDTLIFKFTESGDYPVRLEILDKASCIIKPIASDTLKIRIPKRTLTADTTICAGKTALLVAKGGEAYRWFEGENLLTNRSNSLPIQPTKSTQYKVEITTNGCKDTLTTAVTVEPIQKADFSYRIADPCQKTNLLELFNQSEGTAHFRWEINGKTVAQNQDTLRQNLEKSGTYVLALRILDANKCGGQILKKDTIRIEIPNFSVNKDTTVCSNETLTLSASGGISYAWFEGDKRLNHTSPQLSVSPKTTTVYWVEIVNSKGCKQKIPMRLNVFPKINVSYDVEYLEKCKKPFRLKFTNRSTGISQSIWTINGKTIAANQETLLQTFDTEGNYTVSLQTTDANPCGYPTNFSKTFNVAFPEFSSTPDTTLCFGDALQLRAKGLENFRWSPKTGLSDPNIANPIAQPTETTTYTLTTFNNDCRFEKQITLTVNPPIKLDFTTETQSLCGGLPTFSIQNNSEGATDFRWILGNGQEIREKNPDFSYKSAGEYELTLIGSHGPCQTQISRILKVEPFVPPNAFSPNRDGKNQYFDLGKHAKGLSLFVYNRWGKEVYRAKNYQNDWDGKDLPTGIYFYRFVYPSGKSCKGWVNILR